MAPLRRAVENSLSSLSDFGNEDRRLAEIDGVDNPLKRMGLRAMHAVVAHIPNAVTNCAQPKPKLIKIDEGMRSVVYLYDKDTVIKVVKLASYLGDMPESRAERRRWAGKFQEEHDIMSSYLGQATVAPHEVKVGTDPRNKDREAILIWQPYKDLDYLELTSDIGAACLSAELNKNEAQHPGTLFQLRTMATASRVMFEESGLGLITDVVGKNNIGVDRADGSSLVITDAQPVPKTDGTHGIAMACFEELEMALVA